MDVKYDADLEKILPDLEIVRLRAEVASLKQQLEDANQILEDNDLGEAKPKAISSEEKICLEQIEMLAQLSAKGMPYATEDFKNLETIVKTLISIRNKSTAPDEKSKPKKKNPPNIADLLSIVKNTKE